MVLATLPSFYTFPLFNNFPNPGWDDIGYNFLIGADGNAYMGRGWDRVGIAVIGNFETEGVPVIMRTATRNLIKCAASEGRVSLCLLSLFQLANSY